MKKKKIGTIQFGNAMCLGITPQEALLSAIETIKQSGYVLERALLDVNAGTVWAQVRL